MFLRMFQMCVDQECVKVQPNGCGPSGCGPHGTCNNNGHCHCDSGYAPPTCLTPGYGGSVDSGHSDNYQSKNQKSLNYSFRQYGICFISEIGRIAHNNVTKEEKDCIVTKIK